MTAVSEQGLNGSREIGTQAHREYQERFSPLKAILGLTLPYFKGIQTRYFPNSPILVVESYEGNYSYRAFVLGQQLSRRDSLFLIIYAFRQELPKAIKIPFGPRFGPKREPHFSLAVNLHCVDETSGWEGLAQTGNNGRFDFENVTDKKGPLLPSPIFGKPGDQYVLGAITLKNHPPFADGETRKTIEGRFVEIEERLRRLNLP